MNTVRMADFGSTLTDRTDGKKAFRTIVEKNELPVQLDFFGVVSLGSSFGDEVIPKLAEMQNHKITILNTNSVIRNSVRGTVDGKPVSVQFPD